jgi:hypothetical protein
MKFVIILESRRLDMKSVFADAVVIGGKTKSKLEKGKGLCPSSSILKTREHSI